ncbi:MAG TPA: PAS domain S-box protein [Terriglobales bacterium]|nr:PAS domain S-box protein [Terriglobales bacterium]
MRKRTAQQRWDLSYKITRILSEHSGAQPAIEEILSSLGEAFQFCAGAFWVVDELQVLLRSTNFWTEPGCHFPSFELVTRVRTFPHGIGLPGAAWKSREPVWFPDIVIERNFPRASVAQIEKLHAGIAFPAVHSRRVLGVFEFFNFRPAPPDPELCKFLSALGEQVGLFLHHYHINENLIEEGPTLRIAAERSVDGVITIDAESQVIYANSAIEPLLGWKPDELMGGSITRLMPQQMRPRHLAGIARYVQNGKRHLDWSNIHFPVLHKNGTELPVSLVFGEFWRAGQRVFTGFFRKAE